MLSIFKYNESIAKLFLIFILMTITIECRKMNYRRRFQIFDLRRMNSDEKLNVLLKALLPKRRTTDVNSLAAAALYEVLAKKLLRQHDDPPALYPEASEASIIKDNQIAGIIEHELQDSMSQHKTALQDRPFIQHKGKNDFLVLKSGIKDPFVTVVPNDIYYNAEKKCVNWLDDCNIRGLRQRLLQRVESPYR